MIAAWVFWANFWLVAMTEPERRPTARIYQLDDYRPTNGNGKKPPRNGNGRAA
jgi:hypothetical protein